MTDEKIELIRRVIVGGVNPHGDFEICRVQNTDEEFPTDETLKKYGVPEGATVYMNRLVFIGHSLRVVPFELIEFGTSYWKPIPSGRGVTGAKSIIELSVSVKMNPVPHPPYLDGEIYLGYVGSQSMLPDADAMAQVIAPGSRVFADADRHDGKNSKTFLMTNIANKHIWIALHPNIAHDLESKRLEHLGATMIKLETNEEAVVREGSYRVRRMRRYKSSIRAGRMFR